MLIFDQLKREDPPLRLLSLVVLAGLLLLAAGLWWIQIVHSDDYQSHLETQSYRSIRVPATRGRILDRNGVELAGNRPSYNVSLYLEELRKPLDDEFSREFTAFRAGLKAQRAAREKELGRKLTRTEARQFGYSIETREQIRQRAYYVAASNIVAQISASLGTPLALDQAKFTRHYLTARYQPYPVLEGLNPVQIARFEERFGGMPGVDLDMQSLRVYPSNTLAAHVLGYVRPDKESREGEEAYYSYRLPDYRGLIGIEGGFDKALRGHAGGKSVLVNNRGFKQSENVWQPAVPGQNVVLTLDVRLQQAAELALRKGPEGANTRGAIVVMDVRNGDLLALASSPTFNPNYYLQGFPPNEWARQQDPILRPEFNRATQENYQPGSIFKSVVGMAALENGFNPETVYQVQPDPANPGKGCIFVNGLKKRDTAPPGFYNFRRAFKKSSNSYFIELGLLPGVLPRIVQLGEKLHLGESSGLPTRQETSGIFPSMDSIRSGWIAGDTANLSIGQARIDVTPLQIAVMISAIANNGTVFWPRLVQRLEPQDPLSSDGPTQFPAGRVRDTLDVSAHTLQVLHQAMLADVEDGDSSPGGAGTGTAAAVPGLRIGGKTGTAQVWDAHNKLDHYNTWFASYAPWENPRYAVVVMVVTPPHEGSGGGTCAPLAHDVYEVIQQIEAQPAPLARAN
ncbi:MAG TPA: penicillin-binding transpeptidase domain-containing protein [Verrucomicrobiae bacterium]|nr:penicillin-binding transpeptidase domain-containing protein [Verrucomicrobiae bacterium]